MRSTVHGVVLLQMSYAPSMWFRFAWSTLKAPVTPLLRIVGKNYSPAFTSAITPKTIFLSRDYISGRYPNVGCCCLCLLPIQNLWYHLTTSEHYHHQHHLLGCTSVASRNGLSQEYQWRHLTIVLLAIWFHYKFSFLCLTSSILLKCFILNSPLKIMWCFFIWINNNLNQ